MRPKRKPKPPFSPARRSPASTRSSAKTRPGPASGAGAWRLSAAAASVRRAGRTEDEAALRDAFHLSRPGGDPGPAGQRLLACRELSARPTRQWRSSFAAAAEVLGVPHDEALQEALEAAEACAGAARPAPFAAARAFALARRALTSGAGRPSLGGRGGEGELLAAWLADCRARAAAEMAVRAPLARRAFVRGRRTARGRRKLADGAEATRSSSPTPRRRRARATSRRSWRGGRKSCRTAAPKLRAKGAGAALRALLDEDCLTASAKIGGQISERGARRLFDRLVALGAIRELTGRATFRLYGL